MPDQPVDEPNWLDDTEQRAWRALLAVSSRALPEIQRRLKARDLLGAHYYVFVALSEAPGQTLRLSALADGANMSQSRLTHSIRPLIERGDIAICGDPNDRRAKNASLTDAGRNRLECIAPLHADDVKQLVFDPLTDEQTAALADALTAVSNHLCEHPEYLNPN